MTARRTKAAVIAEAADALESIRPDLAAELRAFPRPGRKTIRDADGFTPTDYAHHALWKEIKRRTDNGEDDAEVLADIAARAEVSEDRLDRLWRVDGEPHLRRLIQRANVGSHDAPDDAG